MRINLDKRRTVSAEVHQSVPLPAGVVWGQMRDWRRFLTLDPLHSAITPAPGDKNNLRIMHRLFGVRVVRRGRLVRWHEHSGYAISDLSMRGDSVGFPHVCVYEVTALDASSSRITIGVRGRWTARWVPPLLVRAWIWWILESTRARVNSELRALIRWRSKRTNDVFPP